MKCPKNVFAEIYRLNMLLGPICKSAGAREAFVKYEKALHAVRQQIEKDTQINECKVSNEK